MKLNNKRNKTNYSNQKGITLIVLVITIVVLLILAGVSINAIFSENGIINKAKDAQNKMDQATQNDLDAINGLSNWIDSKTNGTTGGSTGGNTTGGEDNPPTPTEKPLITDSSLTSKDRTETESQTVIAQDIKRNQVVVPGGFRIADDSGTSVEQGIVIEDKEGNQFVWVPVSNIDGIKAGEEGSTSTPIVKDDGSEVEITLGRYTFKREKNSETGLYEDGTPTPIQKGSEYAQTTVAQATAKTLDTTYGVAGNYYYYYELSDSRTGVESNGTDGTNTTAKNLADFITKTETNKGFYIARYEAGITGTSDNYKLSTKTATDGTVKPQSKEGLGVWNSITQPQAARVSQNMYKNNSYVESDLVNSYAWDTAIVYIQAMGNSNYANQTDGNVTLKNTGKTGDQKCKIFDMAGNTFEWTTEYSTNTSSSSANPCTSRGGRYNDSNYCTSNRGDGNAANSNGGISFRPLLYVK